MGASVYRSRDLEQRGHGLIGLGDGMHKLAALIGFLFMALPAQAANITRVAGKDGIDVILVTGALNSGDENLFRKLAVASEKAVVVMNSNGGNLLAGLEIGRAIRVRGFATAVLPDALCASACALAWLAGSPRLIDPKSNVGFHAAYRMVDGKAQESGVANALVGAYLNQIGLPENAVVYVTSAPPEGIEWLTIEKATRVGISYIAIPRETLPTVTDVREKMPHDPMKTATAFYSALAIADGEGASALVVPEKRGKGPFNEASIRAFFGAMSKPLKMTGAELRGDNDVRVSYEYTTRKGQKCRGRADVETVYLFGMTLISRIKALDGC